MLAAAIVIGLPLLSAALIVMVNPRSLTIVAIEPVEGAHDVASTAKILLTFSRPVDETSVGSAVRVEPATSGFVSAAGRRVVFAPAAALRGGTDYRVTVGTGLRDRSGRALSEPIVIRFRTRDLALVARTADGRLLVATVIGSEPKLALEPLAGPAVGDFALSGSGDLAYVDLTDGRLVVQAPGSVPPLRLPLPTSGASPFGSARRAIDVQELAWAPGRTMLGFVASRRDGLVLPYLVDLRQAAAPVEPFGLAADQIALNSSADVAASKKSLLDGVYRRETFAFTPDGGGIIARDRKWDFVVFGFDGRLRGTFGPFLAVGNISRRGERVAFVDVDPADRRLRRQVIAYERGGRVRPLSGAGRDSHSPRWAHWSDRIVYATAEGTGSPDHRRFALEMLDLASGAYRRLTEPAPGESDDDPQWSPDDAWIVFRRSRLEPRKQDQVLIVRAEGPPARSVALPGVVAARWSP
jgi:hypothetical protein